MNLHIYKAPCALYHNFVDVIFTVFEEKIKDVIDLMC